MTTRTTSTTHDAGVPPAPPEAHQRAGVRKSNFNLKGDHVKRKKLSTAHCECGGVMERGICRVCGWWDGREEPPGVTVDLEAATERLVAYILERMAAGREGRVQR